MFPFPIIFCPAVSFAEDKSADKVPVKTRDFMINCTGGSGYITWMKDNKLLVKRLHVSSDKKHVTIPDVLPMDKGNYSCYSNGRRISSFLLKVDGKVLH